MGPGIPVLRPVPIGLPTASVLVKAPYGARSVTISTFGCTEEPRKCVLEIARNTLTLLVADTNRVLSLHDTSICGFKFKHEPLLLVLCDTATVEVALADPVYGCGITMSGSSSKPLDSSTIILLYAASLLVENTDMVLRIGKTGIAGNLVVLERESTAWPSAQPIIVNCA